MHPGGLITLLQAAGGTLKFKGEAPSLRWIQFH